MKWLGLFLRRLTEVKFQVLGLATIKDIPTGRFEEIIRVLSAEGWQIRRRYEGVDAWIDYGRLKMRKGSSSLTFEWDHWTEGSIEGRRQLIRELGERFELPVCNRWRWSEYAD